MRSPWLAALPLMLLACKPPAPADASTPSEPVAPGQPREVTTEPPPQSLPTPTPTTTTGTPAPPPQGPPQGDAGGSAKMIVELSLEKKGRLKANDKSTKTPPDDAESLAVSTGDGQGQLKADQVRDVLAKRIDDFRPCVTRDSTVRIDATITTSGAVDKATSDRSDPDDPKMRECVIAVFSKLTFPTDWARAGSQDPTRLSLDLRLRKGE